MGAHAQGVPEQGKAMVKVFNGHVITGPEEGLEGTSGRWSKREKLRFPNFPEPGDPHVLKVFLPRSLCPPCAPNPCSPEPGVPAAAPHPTLQDPGQPWKLTPGNFLCGMRLPRVLDPIRLGFRSPEGLGRAVFTAVGVLITARWGC